MAGWTSAHVVLGELENGLKVIMTNVIPDSGAPTVITISPLVNVLAYFGGIKDCGTTPRTFKFAQSGTQSNSITVTPSGDASGGLVGILSIGL